jgi:hypothetical protein
MSLFLRSAMDPTGNESPIVSTTNIVTSQVILQDVVEYAESLMRSIDEMKRSALALIQTLQGRSKSRVIGTIRFDQIYGFQSALINDFPHRYKYWRYTTEDTQVHSCVILAQNGLFSYLEKTKDEIDSYITANF